MEYNKYSETKVSNSKPSMVTFNVRGSMFKIDRQIISKLPQLSPFTESLCHGTHLTLETILKQHSEVDKEIYVNSNPFLFHCVIDYLTNGVLHFPENMCIDVIERELKFWGFPEKSLASCCFDRVLKERESKRTNAKLTRLWKFMIAEKKYRENKPPDKDVKASTSKTKKMSESMDKIRERIWNILEKPNSSIFAKIWMVIGVIVVMLSILNLMLETEPNLRRPSFEAITSEANITIGNGLYKYYITSSVTQPWIVTMDTICTIILSVEFILRFIVSTAKKKFVRNPLNIVDLLGLLPMWIHFLFTLVGQIFKYNSTWMQAILDALSFFRLFRILRFGRIMMMNKQLKIVFLALIHSWKELCIMCFVIIVSATIFGSVIYFCELANDKFLTIFHGMWWSIITMTTVGYGDFFPETGGGYFIGVICSLCGIIHIALATTVIVNHFLVTYTAVECYERAKKCDCWEDIVNKSGKNDEVVKSEVKHMPEFNNSDTKVETKQNRQSSYRITGNQVAPIFENEHNYMENSTGSIYDNEPHYTFNEA